MNWFKKFWKALNEPVKEAPGFVEIECYFTPRAQQALNLARKVDETTDR